MKFPAKKGRRIYDSIENDNDCLRGLRAAAFIANSLDKSKDKEWIIAKFHGDEELVNMWISFIQHNGWIYKNLREELGALQTRVKSASTACWMDLRPYVFSQVFNWWLLIHQK